MENKDRTVELVDSKDEEISIPIIQDEANDSEHNIESSTKMEPYEDHEDLDSLLDDEEDVPSDFFDDFSNQDFMAGLDVVDAWDDEEVINVNEKNASSSKKERRGAERTRRHRSRSPNRSRYRGYNYSDRRRYLKEKFRASRDKDRKRRSKSKEKLKDIEKKPKESNETTASLPQDHKDHRRDPEKTKRDIQKDKDKCEKSKEAKIICEKLKVVETGLVPPGTEMEIDLKQLKSTVMKESEKKTSSITLHEEKHHKSRSIDKGYVHSRVLYKEKRYSPIARRISRSPDRTYDRRFSYKFTRSPYRGRSRSRSLRRRTSSERRRYIEERRRIRRYRDCSPTILKRRSKNRSSELSPISNLSEREMWLRQRERQRTRNVSLSPISDSDSTNRKRSRDFLEELADKLKSDRKKKSFLKEIQEQLNEPSKPRSHYSVTAPVPVPSPITGPKSMPPIHHRQMHVPNPVPGGGFVPTTPQYFSPQIDPAPQYDQQFFIGQPDTFHNPSYQPYMGQLSCPGVTSNMHIEQFDGSTAPGTDALSHPINSPINNSYTKVNVNVLQAQKAAELQKEKDKEAIAKLFEDKKISLSDFLSMCAKHADSTKPVNVQKKVKVISLCQDAIKAVGGDSNLNGRFFLKKTYKEVEKPQEGKFQSPLRKIPVVRFNFTTPSKGGEDKSTLQNTLNKLLISLGLIERSTSTVSKATINSSASETSMKISTQPQVSTPTKPAARKYDPILGAKFQMKMCQTDPVKCHICEIRKSRKFVNQGVQCDVNTTETGTQITDEDLQRLGLKVPIKDALRNQSFAHLTPAQLLASTMGHEESLKKDIFSAAKVLLTPPPPDISPEKQKLRVSSSNNNSFPNRSDYLDNRYNLDSYNSQNSPNRPAAHKPPSIFDKMIPNPFGNKRPNNPFDNASRPNPFEGSLPSRANIFDSRLNANMQQDQFHGSSVFNPRLQNENDFEPPSGNGGPNANQRQFFPPQRGKFLPSGQPYDGRNFF